MGRREADRVRAVPALSQWKSKLRRVAQARETASGQSKGYFGAVRRVLAVAAGFRVRSGQECLNPRDGASPPVCCSTCSMLYRRRTRPSQVAVMPAAAAMSLRKKRKKAGALTECEKRSAKAREQYDLNSARKVSLSMSCAACGRVQVVSSPLGSRSEGYGSRDAEASARPAAGVSCSWSLMRGTARRSAVFSEIWRVAETLFWGAERSKAREEKASVDVFTSLPWAGGAQECQRATEMPRGAATQRAWDRGVAVWCWRRWLANGEERGRVRVVVERSSEERGRRR
jgi:hypothetical protein